MSSKKSKKRHDCPRCVEIRRVLKDLLEICLSCLFSLGDAQSSNDARELVEDATDDVRARIEGLSLVERDNVMSSLLEFLDTEVTHALDAAGVVPLSEVDVQRLTIIAGALHSIDDDAASNGVDHPRAMAVRTAARWYTSVPSRPDRPIAAAVSLHWLPASLLAAAAAAYALPPDEPLEEEAPALA